MSSIIFKGIDIKNRARNIKVEIFDRIDFTRLGLQSIDLSPLKEWEFSNRVRIILLRENYLSKIDLDPLSSCTNLHNLALDKNSLSTIDLSPLTSCKRLYKLYLYHNNLSEIDLKPLKNLKDLSVLFLHGNLLSDIDLSHLPSSIKRIGINENYNLINADQFFEKITYENETRPQIKYQDKYESNQEYEEDYGYEEDFSYQEDNERSSNDQRSDVLNPNNPEHQAALDNRANQLNPQHPAYRSSRGKK
jgi:Leucine-rich repeat (LRR) protein